MFGSVNTDGTASVSLGVFAQDFLKNAGPYGANCIILNVSMIGNTRMGIQYVYDTVDGLYDWMKEDWPNSVKLRELSNCDDDNGTWVDPADCFRFEFYGGKYRNVASDNATSKVWVCTNGFIAFDLSNSTSSNSYSIPNPASPNAVIAPLWTDLKIDSQSKIIIMESTYWTTRYLVIIWKNALDESISQQRLTFAVALEEYSGLDEGQLLPGGNIYMAYQSVTAINCYFTYGIEDQEGRKGAGRCAYGNELTDLNGKTLVFHQSSINYFIKHVLLTFEDDQDPSYARYIIQNNDPSIRGYNIKTKTGSSPEKNEAMAWEKPIIGAVSFLTGYAGAGVYWVPYITVPVTFGLIAWGFYDAYIQHQYNSIEWKELKDSATDPGIQCAYIKVPGNNNTIRDTSLNIIVAYYTLNQSPHNLKITGIVEHAVYPNGESANVTTSVNLETYRDNNNSFDTASEIQSGSYGEDPMLWLALTGYDTVDFYKIYLQQNDTIHITMTPPIGVNFDLYLYNPVDRNNPVASSRNNGDAPESITFTANSAGWWFIKVISNGGWGFYTMSTDVEHEREFCPFVCVWNGRQFIIDNNLLPTSLRNNGTDVEDYYKLEQILIPRYQSALFSLYSLQIREFESEHSYIDQIKLLAVDHNPDFNIAVTPNGEIVNYWQPLPSISCIDNKGNNRLNEILFMDGNVSDPTTYFYGEKGDYLTLDFGIVNAENAKLILRSDMKCYHPEMDPPCCIEVQVLNDSEWQTAAVVAPREYWATEAVNLSPYVVANQDLKVRLYWTLPHRLDYVGLDTSPPDQMRVISVPAIQAIHSTQGSVTAKLLFNDQNYAELIPNEQITLTFILPNNPPTKTRTFILYTEGHYYTITN